jgi:hypothetical protein
MPARAVKPCDSHAITFFQVRNPRPDSRDDSRSFVAWDEGHYRLDRPIAVHSMQIGVTYSSRKYFHKRLPWPRRWDGNFSYDQRRTKFFNNGCFHGFCV